MNKSLCYRLALLSALASLAILKLGAWQVCGAARCHALPMDVAVLTQLQAWRRPWLDSLFMIVTWAGSMTVLVPLALLQAWLARATQGMFTRSFVLLALLSHWPIIHVAKRLVARPRPMLFESIIALPGDGSFPSAHAAQIAVFVVACVLHPTQGLKPAAITLLIGLALCVALSRLYLEVHYPSDVLYGMAAGLLWVMALRFASLAQLSQHG